VDRTTAHDTIRTHQPSRWRALIGRNRCRDCRRRWPCGPWLHAVDDRGRDDSALTDRIVALAAAMREQTAAGAAAMTDTIGRRPSDELGRYFGGAANQGRWS